MASSMKPPIITVTKRSGNQQLFSRAKLLLRLRKATYDLDTHFIDINRVHNAVCAAVVTEMATDAIDVLSAQTAAALTTVHPDYSIFAGHIEVARLHRSTRLHRCTHDSFSATCMAIFNATTNLLSTTFIADVLVNADALDAAILHGKDDRLSYLAIMTMERSYLISVNQHIVERPQHMFMRVAVALHGTNIDAVLETYTLLSDLNMIHASPTLSNAGTVAGQLCSCFLMDVQSNSIDALFDSAKAAAEISVRSGGLGLALHDVAESTKANGAVDLPVGIRSVLRLFDATAQLTIRGARKRPSAMTVYLEMFHPDIMPFLRARSTRFQEELTARNVHYACWVPDIFMRRVENDAMWTLFPPSSVQQLPLLSGPDFDAAYENYEQLYPDAVRVPAREIFDLILRMQIENGEPFMLYKDAINAKSNQANSGTIRSSNLCTEITQYSSAEETAVCTLGSVVLTRFVTGRDRFDFHRLHDVVKILVGNLNRIIDVNAYPTMAAEFSSRRHRAIGVGVQGLADVFMLMRVPFESNEARALNILIFETIYHAALERSTELARTDGPYETWEGSPTSRGQLQFDLWGVQPTDPAAWQPLRASVGQYGLRNALLVAAMPTASTSQLTGVNDGIEPYTSNVFLRRTLSGEYQSVCRPLVDELTTRGLWNNKTRAQILENYGSVQSIDEIPQTVKDVFKTAWEIKQQAVVDMAADRAPFICQSQSMSIHLDAPTMAKLASMHFYGWRRGLKTGMYYLRTRPAARPIQFTVPRTGDPVSETATDEPEMEVLPSSGCMSCSA